MVNQNYWKGFNLVSQSIRYFIYKMLTKKLTRTFTQMILFNGPLSFSPNTINNTYMSYALAKKWEQEDAPYETWMKLISTVKEINDDMQAYARWKQTSLDDLRNKYNLKVFSDWNIEGDGAVYSDFTARAVFDSSSPTPFQVLTADERFPVSSPLGYHKAILADMDTDSQSKTKLFAYQLILDNKLSLALQPTEFRNMSKKYSRDLYGELQNSYNDGNTACVFAVDWFTLGNMQLLSHKDTFSAKQKILNDFALEIKAAQQAKLLGKQGKERLKQIKQNYILKMNQFNYNFQTKLSYVSGYIQSTAVDVALPTAHWRTVKIFLGKDSSVEPYEIPPFLLPNVPKTLYMRNVEGGVLFDLNNVLEVVTVNGEFAFKDKVKVTLTEPASSTPSFEFELTRELIEKQVGMHFIKGATLKEVTYNVKVQYHQESSKQYKSHNYLSHQKANQAEKARYFEGTESEYTFEVLDRFKKTNHIGTGDNALNIENYSPYITFDFQCMRFGAPIPKDILSKTQVTLTFSYNYQLGNTPMDVRGIFQYADGKSDQILKEALSPGSPFAHKYKNMDNVKQQYYQGRYDDITKIANDLKKDLEIVTTSSDGKSTKSYFWKNSKGQHFAPQFNNPNQSVPSLKKTVTLDANGRGSFDVYLNENLTRFNNPRTLRGKFKTNDISNPILSSLAIDCTVNAVITTPNGQTNTGDGISGIYFENNADLGTQYPDWKNYVGPRLRLMGLLYPAMQKIVNLYTFNQVDLEAMKRAFDIEDERHSRYMPSTRQISSFEHRMIRRWLYEPFFDNANHTNVNFKSFQAKYRTLSFQQTKRQLRQKLKDAFSFELFTIPLYLTAMYTAESQEYQQVFRQVLHDEMKHLFIASNLINAIREPGCTDPKNGPPYLDPDYVPKFIEGQPALPRYVYDISTSKSEEIKKLYSFGIYPLSQDVLIKMIAAEFPSETKNLFLSTEGDLSEDNITKIKEVQEKVINVVNAEQASNPKFHTIGELYAEIVTLLWDLHDQERKDIEAKNVLFSGDAANQFTYPQLSHMQEIYSLRTALNQIRLIVDEGEGSRIFDVKNKLKKLSHFLLFVEIYTGCKVDQEKTDQLNSPQSGPNFTIYFRQNTVLLNNRTNNWTPLGQDAKVRKFVDEELPGRKAYGYSNYTNVVSVQGFNNVYKKILLELHYVFNSSFKNFKEFAQKKQGISPDDLPALENAFKNFKFRRMENAIAKMRQMSLHARYNIRQEPLPNHQLRAPLDSIESKGNQRLSVRPDYTVEVEFPDDE